MQKYFSFPRISVFSRGKSLTGQNLFRRNASFFSTYASFLNFLRRFRRGMRHFYMNCVIFNNICVIIHFIENYTYQKRTNIETLIYKKDDAEKICIAPLGKN